MRGRNHSVRVTSLRSIQSAAAMLTLLLGSTSPTLAASDVSNLPLKIAAVCERNDGRAYAIIENTITRVQDVFEPGNNVFDLGTLKSITPNAVLVKRKENDTVESIPRLFGSAAPALASRPKAASSSSEPNTNRLKRNSMDQAGTGWAANSSQFVIAKVNDGGRPLYVLNKTELMKLSRIAPIDLIFSYRPLVVKRGDKIGLQLGVVPEDSIGEELGFRPKDVIFSINGVAPTDVTDALVKLPAAFRSPVVELEFERGEANQSIAIASQMTEETIDRDANPSKLDPQQKAIAAVEQKAILDYAERLNNSPLPF